MYKALHSDITIKKSSIHGLGIFAIKSIPKDTVLGVSHVKDKDNTGHYHIGYIRTPLGGFINHSTQPNCIKVIPRLKLSPRHWPTIKEGSLSSLIIGQCLGDRLDLAWTFIQFGWVE